MFRCKLLGKSDRKSVGLDFLPTFLVTVHLLLEMLQNLAQSELYLDPAAEDVASRFSAIYQRERGQLNAKRELTRRRGDRGPTRRP